MKRLILTASIYLLAGCTAMVGSRNTDFIKGQSNATDQKSTLMICRPSNLNQVFNSAGVTINSSPITEIGSGEVYSIDFVRPTYLVVTISLPITDLIKNLWEKQKEFNLRLNPAVPLHYVILYVSNGDIDASPNMAGNPAKETVWTVTTQWTAKEVDAKTFNSSCPSSKTQYLVANTLPQITSVGVPPGFRPVPAIVDQQTTSSIKSSATGDTQLPMVDISKLKVVKQPDADALYPAFSRRAGEQGSAVVRLTIGKNGQVEAADLIRSSTFPRLDRAAIDIAKDYSFKPYLINGAPTLATTNLNIAFRLPESKDNTSVESSNFITFLPDPNKFYFPKSKENKESGVAIIEADINAEGAVTKTNPIQKTGFLGLDVGAMALVSKTIFKPTVVNGIPVVTKKKVQVTFDLTSGVSVKILN